MYTITERNMGGIYNLVACVVDTRDDVNTVPTRYAPGSEVTVIEDSSLWKLGHDGLWHEMKPAGSAGSGSGGNGGGCCGGGSSSVDKDSIISEAVSQSKEYADLLLKDISNFKTEIVEVLPFENVDPSTIYLLKKNSEEEDDLYDEFMWINDQWELLGSTKIGDVSRIDDDMIHDLFGTVSEGA